MGSSSSSPWCCSGHSRVAAVTTMQVDYEKIGCPSYIGLHVKPFKLPVCKRDQILAAELYNTLNDGTKWGCYIHEPLYALLLDTRTLQEYAASHIQSAFHCSAITTTVIRQNLKQFTHIILYGSDTKLDYSDDYQTALTLLEDHNVEFQSLVGGYSEFSRRFPFMCSATNVWWSRDDREGKLRIYPSLILEDWLYQGNAQQAKDEEIITGMGITHILNISTEHDCSLPNVQYLAIRLPDNGKCRLVEYFEDIFEFLDGAKRTGGKALVHCNLGVSRSSAATLSYMMLSERCSLLDAVKYLRHRRPVCAPNLGFFLQLGQFEEYVFGKSLTDANALWLAI